METTLSNYLQLFAIVALVVITYLALKLKTVKTYDGVTSLKYEGSEHNEKAVVSIFTDKGSWILQLPARFSKLDGFEKVRVTITRSFLEAPEIHIKWLGEACDRDFGDVYVS
jgi:hypothetical protein